MNVIKGLIIKDFQTIKSYKSTIIFMLIIFIGSAFLNDGMSTVLPVFMPLCFGMFAISAFSYDSLANADKYILTFPINKKDIVKARYIYILLFTLVGALFGFALTILVQSIKSADALSTEMIGNISATVFGGLFGIIFLQVFQIPIMYKFGPEKGRIIQIIMIVALMLGVSLLTVDLMKLFELSLDSVVAMLKNYLLLVIGISVVILYIISYAISCKIYNKKEI